MIAAGTANVPSPLHRHTQAVEAQEYM